MTHFECAIESWPFDPLLFWPWNDLSIYRKKSIVEYMLRVIFHTCIAISQSYVPSICGIAVIHFHCRVYILCIWFILFTFCLYCTYKSFNFSYLVLHLSLGIPIVNPRVQYRNQLSYVGRLKACIFDWSGTVVDCGVFGPTVIFMEIFKNEGVPITIDEARAPMGIHKKVQ